ncbi:hypothetical protein ABI59_13450 [Acidobacteria bacterium Mor1]|nr:hypothetical protein ABI59_13450 [Acidobacteria bacterium Mor1]
MSQSTSRRVFLRSLAGVSVAWLAPGAAERGALADVKRAVETLPPDPADAARDELFWSQIRAAYRQSPLFSNMESGFYSPTPEPVLETMCDGARRINETPSFYMRRRQDEERAAVRRELARFVGVGHDEIVVTRNTTESLNTVIHGLELGPDDGVLYCGREYSSMREALEQRAERYGLNLQKIDLPYLPGDPDAIVKAYADAITPATKVILVSHVIYLTGQILPVRAICDMAHARGIEVICDAAHSIGHLEFKIPDLDCDYLGSSLHKWLGAPLGNGLLYVRKNKIPKVWPLLGDSALPKDDIRKLEHLGTLPVHNQLAIAHAIRFHESIGSARKEARLRHLKDSWTQRVIEHPRVGLATPTEPERSCAIATVTVDGIDSHEVARRLYDEHRVFTVAVPQGVRIAPNLHATKSDVDRLVEGLLAIAG